VARTHPSSVKCHVREDAWGRRSTQWLKGSESPEARHARTRRELPCFPIDSPPRFPSFSPAIRRLTTQNSDRFPASLCFPVSSASRLKTRLAIAAGSNGASSSLLENEENLADTRSVCTRVQQRDPTLRIFELSFSRSPFRDCRSSEKFPRDSFNDRWPNRQRLSFATFVKVSAR